MRNQKSKTSTAKITVSVETIGNTVNTISIQEDIVIKKVSVLTEGNSVLTTTFKNGVEISSLEVITKENTLTTISKKGTKTTKTIKRNNIETVIVSQGYAITTTATITNGDDTMSYILKVNGLAPKEFIIKVNNVRVSDKPKPIAKVRNFKSDFDIETFEEIRQTILDYAEAEEIDFFTALEEIAPHSTILSTELNDSEISVILNISIDQVIKLVDTATRKLKNKALQGGDIRELKDQYDLDNQGSIKIRNNVPMYHSEGALVV